MYDFHKMLALEGVRETDFVRGSTAGLLPDGTADVRYGNVPYGALNDAAGWLAKNRTVLTDASVAGQTLEGAWRTSAIFTEVQRDRGGSVAGIVLVQRLAKGFYEAWDWGAVREAEASTLDGNTGVLPPSTTLAEGGVYRQQVVLRMPYVDASKADDVAAAVAANHSFTNLEYNVGQKLSGVWWNNGVSRRLEQDGTVSIILALAQPKYTIYSFSGNDTFEREDVYLCAGVPMSQVNALIAEWKAPGGVERTGASARAGQAGDGNTVDVILTIPTPKAVTGQSASATEDLFSRSVQTNSINQAAAATETAPAFVAGTIRRVSNEQTPMGKWNTGVGVQTAKAVYWTWTWPTEHGDAYGYEGRNQATENPGATDGYATKVAGGLYRVSGSPNKNEFGLWDYQYALVPYPAGGEDPVSVTVNEKTYQFRTYTYLEETEQYLIYVWTRHVKHFKSQSACMDWLEGDASGEESPPRFHVDWNYVGHGGGWYMGVYDELYGYGKKDDPDSVVAEGETPE